MRKIILIAIAGAALGGAGLAVADGFDSKSVSAVSATFTATTANVVKTSTCTATNGHVYATTRATYTGTAGGSSDPSLNGAISLDTQSLIDTTASEGTVSGKLKIGSGDTGTNAHFEAVYSKGNIAGFAEGHTQDPHTHLLGNLSGGFSTGGGFAAGSKLGGGTSGGDAVEMAPGGCKPAPAPKPDRIQVNGVITAVSSTSITAAGVTCSVPTSISVGGLKVGDRVEMTCTVSGGTNTLAKVSSHHDKGDKN
jgi:hypothetical protein